uniref:Uncharacterized protein n=1 Tax=Bostrychia simpliciuscula TaxID=324754 RepID=A0A1Z1M807_9FLOR|nr:hypothetical protein [Bostrychia simpliciuscula]ARW62100.1 hypothetical protein [Bostrychia simpliciuscula]
MVDLSGGQILKKIAKNVMQLRSNSGTYFYDFSFISNENLFKDKYRNFLNKIPLYSKQIDSIIAKANIAFSLNIKIFQEHNFNLIKIMLMLLLSSISSFRKKFLFKSYYV